MLFINLGTKELQLLRLVVVGYKIEPLLHKRVTEEAKMNLLQPPAIERDRSRNVPPYLVDVGTLVPHTMPRCPLKHRLSIVCFQIPNLPASLPC